MICMFFLQNGPLSRGVRSVGVRFVSRYRGSALEGCPDVSAEKC
jgi:hypothetical protein